MKSIAALCLPALLMLISCGSVIDSEHETARAPLGAAPVIDGTLSEGEWADALHLQPADGTNIFLKHDGMHLYVGLDGDGGNFYFLRDGAIEVLHASYSLGWTAYAPASDSKWTCTTPYDFHLHGLHENDTDEVQRLLAAYLGDEGWAASPFPLGTPQQSEYIISLEWLGVAEASGTVTLPPCFLRSFRNLPREERDGRNLVVAWPAACETSREVNRGESPAEIECDTSGWGRIRIEIDEE